MGDTADMEDPEPTEDREEWMRWADNRIIDLEAANAKLTAERDKAQTETKELRSIITAIRRNDWITIQETADRIDAILGEEPPK